MMPTVITAISNSEVESFVAGNLFTQGWSVVFRAIDCETLDHFIENNPEIAKSALLIFANDLAGLDQNKVNSFANGVRQLIGFNVSKNGADNFLNLHEVPKETTELVSLVRGFVRAPMMRALSSNVVTARKAKVIAVGSAGSHTGCTSISINLAMELSALGQSTLLIEANFRAPSISTYLAMRNIKSDVPWRNIAPNLSLAEVDQDQAGRIDEFMDRAAAEFDWIVVDIGSISGLSNRLTDRRWTSTMTTWCCDQADELLITSRPDIIGVHRLQQVAELLQQTSIKATLSFVLNMKSLGKRGDSEESQFLNITTPLKPLRVRTITKDPRAFMAAEAERATLIETNERSNVRKSIAELAREIKS